jgi:hypothetical protein
MLGAGVVIAYFGQASLPALVVGIVLIVVGASGAFWPRRPSRADAELKPLVMMMRQGRAIRDSMGRGRINPNNSRANESRCRKWESASHEAIMRFDHHLAESFLLGSPEVHPNPPHHHDGIDWLLFMEGRLRQLDEAMRVLRARL